MASRLTGKTFVRAEHASAGRPGAEYVFQFEAEVNENITRIGVREGPVPEQGLFDKGHSVRIDGIGESLPQAYFLRCVCGQGWTGTDINEFYEEAH